jgi:hypothetical protein
MYYRNHCLQRKNVFEENKGLTASTSTSLISPQSNMTLFGQRMILLHLCLHNPHHVMIKNIALKATKTKKKLVMILKRKMTII